MSFESMYPSTTGGSGVTLSPLSIPAPVAAEPLQAAQPEVAAVVSLEPQAASSEAPEHDVAHAGSGDVGDLLDDLLDDATQEEAASVEETPTVDMTIDSRKDFFANARMSEPEPTSPTDYATVTRTDPGVPREGIDNALRACVKVGIGQSEMDGLFKMFIDTARNGAIRTTPEAATAVLQAEYGDKFDSKMASAKALVAKVEQTWPGAKAFLTKSGIGNDPDVIRRLVVRAERRGL